VVPELSLVVAVTAGTYGSSLGGAPSSQKNLAGDTALNSFVLSRGARSLRACRGPIAVVVRMAANSAQRSSASVGRIGPLMRPISVVASARLRGCSSVEHTDDAMIPRLAPGRFASTPSSFRKLKLLLK
jgi:hypothetical protein